MQTNINSVWQIAQGLSRIDKIILMEKLAHQLKKEIEIKGLSKPVKEMYGMGKGIWNTDAQEYVAQLREERF